MLALAMASLRIELGGLAFLVSWAWMSIEGRRRGVARLLGRALPRRQEPRHEPQQFHDNQVQTPLHHQQQDSSVSVCRLTCLELGVELDFGFIAFALIPCFRGFFCCIYLATKYIWQPPRQDSWGPRWRGGREGSGAEFCSGVFQCLLLIQTQPR